MARVCQYWCLLFVLLVLIGAYFLHCPRRHFSGVPFPTYVTIFPRTLLSGSGRSSRWLRRPAMHCLLERRERRMRLRLNVSGTPYVCVRCRDENARGPAALSLFGRVRRDFRETDTVAPAAGEMFWDGPATKRRGGDTHYLAFVLGGERIALGGNVLPFVCLALRAQGTGPRREPKGDPLRRRCSFPCL
jgi:hypothetical protein